LVKICHENGQYGFSHPFQFSSVVELVDFYQVPTPRVFFSSKQRTDKLDYDFLKLIEFKEIFTIFFVEVIIQFFYLYQSSRQCCVCGTGTVRISYGSASLSVGMAKNILFSVFVL